MPELVLGQRAHRDVLLEERRDAGPLGVGEADDELVVGHRQQQLVETGDGRGGEVRHGPVGLDVPGRLQIEPGDGASTLSLERSPVSVRAKHGSGRWTRSLTRDRTLRGRSAV